MKAYAEGTSVSVSKSKIEICEMLEKRKAKKVAVGQDETGALVFFELADRFVQFRMPLPTQADAAKLKSKRYSWQAATAEQQTAWLEQRRRERWRALGLVLKAKFAAIDSGVETLETAFLAHIVLPGGGTVGQRALPAVQEAYATGKVTSPLLLGAGGAP